MSLSNIIVSNSHEEVWAFLGSLEAILRTFTAPAAENTSRTGEAG